MGRTERIRKKKQRQTLGGREAFKLDNDSTLISLVKWLKSLGWEQTCALNPTYFPTTGRGLMTAKKISVGETLIQIPLEALITTKTVEQSDVGCILKQQAMLSQEVLTIFLVWENRKGCKSQWASYINSLPKEFSVPLYLPGNLVLPDLLEEAISEAKEVAYRSFVRIRQLLPDLQEDEFRWSWSCVNTRAVYLPQQLSKNVISKVHIMDRNCLALAPYLDLFNHSTNASVDVKVTNSSYQLLTNTPYRKYDQVFINYGPHANMKLFVEYGFAIPGNPHDTLPLDEAAFLAATGNNVPFDKILNAKMAFLRNQGLLNSAAFIRKGLTWSACAAAWLLNCEERNPHGWSHLIYNETETKLDKSTLETFANIAESQKHSFERSLDKLRKFNSENLRPYSAVDACIFLITELRNLAQSASVALLQQAHL